VMHAEKKAITLMHYPHVNHPKKKTLSGEGVLDRCFLKEGSLGGPQCQDQGEVLY